MSAAPVRGSREQLVRLVRNLLENAERHARTRVEVSVCADHDGVELVVSDDGPGVPAEQRERIFERFVRLDEARARDDGGGSGLGLSIVATIAATARWDLPGRRQRDRGDVRALAAAVPTERV